MTGHPTTPTVHATAILLGARGVLIRGPSGAGKSALAAQLIDRRRRTGGFSALVSDDRVALVAAAGRLIARAPASIAGLMELRGHGLVAVDHEPAAVIALVVDLVPPETLVRMPEDEDRTVTIEGVALPRLAVPRGDLVHTAALVEAVLGA